jgi:Manganese containing catalase
MYTVRVGAPDPKLANLILEQFGGPDGELAAAMRYFTQGLAEIDPGPPRYRHGRAQPPGSRWQAAAVALSAALEERAVRGTAPLPTCESGSEERRSMDIP